VDEMNGAVTQGGVFAVQPADLRFDLFAQSLVFFYSLTRGYLKACCGCLMIRSRQHPYRRFKQRASFRLS
jgi:hypothetical protein